MLDSVLFLRKVPIYKCPYPKDHRDNFRVGNVAKSAMVGFVARISPDSDLLILGRRDNLDLLRRLEERRLQLRYRGSLRIVLDATGITQPSQCIFQGGTG